MLTIGRLLLAPKANRVFLLLAFAVLFLWFPMQARADIAVLLEEPYSYDGAFAGTGHAAVYLTRVCALSPTVLRRCGTAEAGVVISRYRNLYGFDWLAIPLIPYLYAVERSSDVPLITNAKIVAALRDNYRRRHLEGIAPDTTEGKTPQGNWYQLVGSTYDRTIYAFQIETTPAQDDAFILAFNARTNQSVYSLTARNCADFAADVINFYYPRAVGRGALTDFGISTPEHVAKSLAKFSRRHRELRFSIFVIPQSLGSIKRSKPVRGVVDAIVKAKKYELPLLVCSPVTGIGFAVMSALDGRPDPMHNATVFAPTGDVEPPLTAAERRAYRQEFEAMQRVGAEAVSETAFPRWSRFLTTAELLVDEKGRPFLRGFEGTEVLEVGIARSNILESSSSRDLARGVLLNHLRDALRDARVPRTSKAEVRADWNDLGRMGVLNGVKDGNGVFAEPKSADERNLPQNYLPVGAAQCSLNPDRAP